MGGGGGDGGAASETTTPYASTMRHSLSTVSDHTRGKKTVWCTQHSITGGGSRRKMEPELCVKGSRDGAQNGECP